MKLLFPIHFPPYNLAPNLWGKKSGSYLSSSFGFSSRRDLRQSFRSLPVYGNSRISIWSQQILRGFRTPLSFNNCSGTQDQWGHVSTVYQVKQSLKHTPCMHENAIASNKFVFTIFALALPLGSSFITIPVKQVYRITNI